MAAQIEFTDIKNEYLTIAEAREADGLRIVLGAYTVPGPWREACKGVFHVKGLSYKAVCTGDGEGNDMSFGLGGSFSELRAWTGQESAPVVVWNDERPRYTWVDQLNLAERLQPEPALIPTDINERVRMFGLINELAGENGFGWCRRLAIVDQMLGVAEPGTDDHAWFSHLANKYLYSKEAAAAAPARMAEVITTLDEQLAAQQAAGSKYMIGDSLSALDIYWSTFIVLLSPMDQARCPMASAFEAFYCNPHPETQAALTERLIDHRDFIYSEHLELPISF